MKISSRGSSQNSDRENDRTTSVPERPRRLKRLWITGLLLATALVAFFLYREQDSFVCGGCGSSEVVSQWRIGGWPGPAIPLSPKWTTAFHASHLYQDLLGPTHFHTWFFRGGNPKHIFGIFGGCMLGRGAELSELSTLYEQEEGFRTFVAGERKGRVIPLNTLISALVDSNGSGEAEALRHRLLVDYELSKKRH